MEETLVQASVPRELVDILGVEPQSYVKARAFTEAFLKNSIQRPERSDLQDMLRHKAVILNYKRPKKDTRTQRRKDKKKDMMTNERKGKWKDTRKHAKVKSLNARQKRELKVFQIKPEHQRYELFLPLHELWRQYIIDLCNGLKPTSNPQVVQQRLLKADFHGAIITVVRSKCPSYVGTSGILVQEFKHVFKIITKDDKLKVIPKRNSVFSVEINGFVSHIYGSKFEHRASERAAKKFKVKGSIDL